jgi:NADH-quinone oxidoreductase subunit N
MNNLLIVISPAIVAAGAILVILADALLKKSAPWTFRLSLLTLIGGMFTSMYFFNRQGSAFGGMFYLDSFSLLASMLFMIAAFVTLLMTQDSPFANAQFHSLLLLSVLGMILLVAGGHFLTLFIGLELLSLSIYVLASFSKKDPLSAESGMKYFLLGSFASAFFLYGATFVYGATGSMQLAGIAAAIRTPGFASSNLVMLGIIFLVVGYGFKISIAPFHMWTPDVYEGAPTPVTAFMAATVKAAALASAVRVFQVAFSTPALADFVRPLIWILAVTTMFVGNITAIWQNNLKRLLAYSSIAHAGYMLVGALAAPDQVQQSILYYFAAYVFMNLGAFTIVDYIERTAGITEVDQMTGFAYARPVLAVLMTLFLMSLGGLPPTAGFFAKFYLFRAVLDSGNVWIVVLAVLNSAISFYYYLRIVISMFTPEKERALSPVAAVTLPLIIVLILTLWGTVTLGLFPNKFIELARAVQIAS